MANRSLKYFHYGKYHLEKVGHEYANYIKSGNLLKNGPWSVMDIGCGSGRVLQEVLIPLLKPSISEIVGIDMDSNMIEFCRSKNQNPMVSFHTMNITDEKIPLYLQNRFDVLFSSYCFSHVRNLRLGFENCSKLLKKNGELFFIFQYKTHALYTTYKKMSGIYKWKLFTKEYNSFAPHFIGAEPEVELKSIIKDAGLTPLHHKFEPDFCIDLTKRQLLGIYESLDAKIDELPEDLQKDYRRDFLEIMSEVTNVDFVDQDSLDESIKFNVPTVCLHVKNIDL
ncbi:juvenile hormone acid O-methyltransferase-like [Coccinella septempunctata]|uniref:juvenile hormone acid O-methyltransferase-like n=1 Tax=Coccinella septempunctata TaxID=41139 RepID=UPI001D08A447|nr:juvenile hormone acid O-methyltransferase-like [Coccinella septempunctata]